MQKAKKNTFIQGIAMLMISQIIIKIVGLVYKLYLTNKPGFGDRGNAIYAAGFQIYALFLTISSIGVPNSMAKLISEKVAIGNNKGAYRIFKIAFALFGIIGFTCSMILFFGAEKIANEYLQIPEAKLILIALSPSIFFVAIISVLRGYFNGKENISVTANSQSLEQILKVIFTIFVVELIFKISNGNTELMAEGAALASTASSVYTLYYLYKFYKNKKVEVWQEVVSSVQYKKERIKVIIKNILAVSVPITIASIFSVMIRTVDAVTVVRILKNTIGEANATIQYGILSGKVETLITLPFSLNIALSTALIPAITSAIAIKRMDIVRKRIKFSIIATILIGLPSTVIIYMFSNEILHILFPNACLGAEMLKLSSVSIIFVVLTQTVNGVLQGMGKNYTPVLGLGIGFIIKIIFNILLLPIETLGINGAIISSILSHIATFLVCAIILKKEMKSGIIISKYFIKPIIAALNMSLCAYFLYQHVIIKTNELISIFISCTFGAIVYITTIILLKIFSEEEILMLPYGKIIYRLFTKIGIYKRCEIAINKGNKKTRTV